MRVHGVLVNRRAWLRKLGGTAMALLLALAPWTLAGAAPAAKRTHASKTIASPAAKTSAKAERKAERKTHSASQARVAAGGRKASVASRSGRVASRHERLSLRRARQATHEAPAPRLSFGQLAGLHQASDPLDLQSSVALVVDQDTQEILLSKNEQAVLPIASLTKLMTGLVVSEAHLPMDESITITQEDVDTEKGSRSRLAVGTELTRGELLHLALMSSENRAAHALGRTFPGGLSHFVSLMNARATRLGMADTRYVEPTGLSSANRSSARDLAGLVAAAAQDPLLRELTTSPAHEIAVGSRVLQYRNTNALVRKGEWDIGLQKTGYISEAGRCLVMQARIAGRKLIMVFLDSTSKAGRLDDAERVRRWVELRWHPSAIAGQGRADPDHL